MPWPGHTKTWFNVDATISKLRDGFVFLLAPTWRLGMFDFGETDKFRNMALGHGQVILQIPKNLKWFNDVYIGMLHLPVTVTTRIIKSLDTGIPINPSFATIGRGSIPTNTVFDLKHFCLLHLFCKHQLFVFVFHVCFWNLLIFGWSAGLAPVGWCCCLGFLFFGSNFVEIKKYPDRGCCFGNLLAWQSKNGKQNITENSKFRNIRPSCFHCGIQKLKPWLRCSSLKENSVVPMALLRLRNVEEGCGG